MSCQPNSTVSHNVDWTNWEMLSTDAVSEDWSNLYLINPTKHKTDFFDIVLVHQLGGHAQNSWQAADTSGFFWPTEISKTLPDARVWSFGYPRRQKIILGNVARDLRNQLGLLRRKDAEAGVISSTDIPKIIFISAGIGGVIVKKAILDCKNSNDASELSIWKGCVGLMFLGTPHGRHQEGYRGLARAHGMLIDHFKDTPRELRGQCLDVDDEAIVDDMGKINTRFLNSFPDVPPSLSIINEDYPALDPLAPQKENGTFQVSLEGTEKYPITRHIIYWYAFEDPNDGVLRMILDKLKQWKSRPIAPREPGLRLLSLDGGGVRGLCSLIILDRIMDQVQKVEVLQNHGLPMQTRLPCDYFELAGGSSTGGLIAIMLFRLRMDTKSTIREYKRLAPKIFRSGLLGGIKAAFIGSIFDGNVLEAEIKDLVLARLSRYEREALDSRAKDAPLRPGIEALRGLEQGKMFTTAVLRPEDEALRLRSYWPCEERPCFGGCTIWEAARATSAAPFYFPPAFIADKEFWDGGIQNNNPIDEIDAERRALWPLRKVSCIVSVGTGKSTMVSSSCILALRKVTALIENLANTENRHRSFLDKAKAERIEYFRFNPTTADEKIGLADYHLLDELEKYTEEYLDIAEVQRDIERCAGLLVKRTFQ